MVGPGRHWHSDGVPGGAGLHLYWLPLGAGGSPVVRLSGRAYERAVAWREHRRPLALYHAALRLCLDGVRYVVEVAPAWERAATGRGVVARGGVGSRLLARSVLFRYELRCWPGGVIPDEGFAVDSPVELPTDDSQVRLVLDRVADVPTPVWGRDELQAGEMWNSNSVIGWLLTVTGHPCPSPPAGGRAPGWDAGVRVAGRHPVG